MTDLLLARLITANMEILMVSARRRWLIVLCTAASLCLSAQPFAQRQRYSLFTDDERRYSVEYPKEWSSIVVAGSGEPITKLVDPKREAAVVIERFRLRVRLAPDEVTDLFAEIEADVLKENQPKATDVSAKVVAEGRTRLIVIDYSRPGVKERDRVRQYSYIAGSVLFRVTCSALTSVFAKYEPTFAIVAGSLKTELGQPPPPGRR